MHVFFAATLGSLTVDSGAIFGIVGTLCCITLGGVALGVVTFLVIIGVTCAVDQEYVIAYTLGSVSMGDESDVSLFLGKS